MNYKDCITYWNQQASDPIKWDYKGIEDRMTTKLRALKNAYNNAKNDTLKKQLSQILHLDELHQTHDSGDYDLSEKIIIHYPKTPVFYIGDLHSDASGLDDIIRQLDPYNIDCHLIFLGDYVDRGKKHLETLDKLWALKLDLPDQITLLRGNHDGGYYDNNQVILPYRLDSSGLEDDYFPLYLEKLRTEALLSKSFNVLYFDFCTLLPQVIFTYQNKQWYMGVHGGLPRPSDTVPYYDYIPSIGALESINSLDHFNQPLLDNLFWSDPREGALGNISEKRRFNTYEDHFNSFAKRFGIAEMIRGHETVKTGHLSIYNDKVHTIFSSGLGSPDTAYEKVELAKILKLENGHPLTEHMILREKSSK